MLQNGEEGKGLIYGISQTTDRKKIFNFSDTIFQQHVWLVTLCGKQFPFHTLADLKNKTISLAGAASVSEEFDQNAGILFKVDKDSTNTEGRFLKLVKNRIDAVIHYSELDARTLEKYINLDLQSIKNVRQSFPSTQFCVISKPVATTNIHFALSKQLDPELISRLNIVIAKAKKTKTTPRLYQIS